MLVAIQVRSEKQDAVSGIPLQKGGIAMCCPWMAALIKVGLGAGLFGLGCAAIVLLW